MIGVVREAGRPVAAVERAIALLDVLADGGGPRGVNDLARALDVHASTVSRLLGTLAASGLVERESYGSGRYRLGLRLAYWGSEAIAGRDLRELARPLLAELASLTGETATLSLAAGTEAMTADYVASSRTVLSQAHVGRASVGHATAVGKVLLAYRPDALAALPRRLEAFTDRTVVDRSALERELERVHELGFAEASGEREEGLHAIAVPVRDGRGELAAILGLQGPDRFDASARAEALGARRARAARLGASRAV
jgi:DNA-binding IclR family transcriptional regulator